ncbi:MAG: SDR family NAD(P)-dependent oxidoreductase [Armatimonadota bacterium]|jgi:CDP-glucose 4,6-dehydratase
MANGTDGPWASRTALVTGVNGFLGAHLAEALAERGARVVGLVRDRPAESYFQWARLGERITVVEGDVTDLALLERALNECEVDTVMHVAAQAIIGAANRAPLSTFESNIRGTYMLLEACRRVGTVQRIVVASSDKAYGRQEHLPYSEETALGGIYPYDASKACADIVARSYHATFQLRVAVTRCANLYGPGDLNYSRIVPGTVRAVLRGDRPIIRSDGTLERDYLYITDAVSAYLRLAEALARDDVAGCALNFGTGHPISVLDLVRAIIETCGRTDLKPEILGAAGHGEIDKQYLSSEKAQQVLGWEAETALADGLQGACEWYREYLQAG